MLASDHLISVSYQRGTISKLLKAYRAIFLLFLFFYMEIVINYKTKKPQDHLSSTFS
jgi:hypothetical protein